MPLTKILKPKGGCKYHRLLLKVGDKYKVVYKSTLKSEVNLERAKIRAKAVDTNALLSKKTFVDLYKEFALHKIEVGKNEKLGGKLYSLKTYCIIKNLLLKVLEIFYQVMLIYLNLTILKIIKLMM